MFLWGTLSFVCSFLSCLPNCICTYSCITFYKFTFFLFHPISFGDNRRSVAYMLWKYSSDQSAQTPDRSCLRILSRPKWNGSLSYAAPRPESPRLLFSTRNPRSWLCQHNTRAVPFILCWPRPGWLLIKARERFQHCNLKLGKGQKHGCKS